jgi:DNA excision repair protein ERCC-4
MTNSVHGNAKSPIRILVDHREARSAAVAALEAVDEVALDFSHLSVGDYQVGTSLLFERKTLPDLAVSIQDGRLFRQARALATLPVPKRGAIILEGTAADLSGSAMRRESIQGALITVTLFFGIPLLRSMNGEETARLMLYAARQAQWFQSGGLPRYAKRPKGKRRAQLALLQGLPGVGPDRAQRLLERFGSIEAVLTAATEELASVKGIGERTAERIRWVVSEPGASYGAQPRTGDRHLTNYAPE